MTTKTLDFAFELKALKADGTFEGYGSVFGVKDSYDEIVAPGAFAESLAGHKSAGTMPALLWQHRSGEPIGVYTSMTEDNIGLKLTGQLALKTQRGAEAYELLKMGAISGLSIGFQTREDAFDRVTGIRTLKRVDLWETSLVTFPANDAARIQSVKASDLTIRDAEKALREVGFSQSDAKAILASGYKTLSGREVDDSGDEQRLKAVVSALIKR
jgi:uncharacterized protein